MWWQHHGGSIPPFGTKKMQILGIILKIVGGVVFLYLTWRRLGEDYDEKKLTAFSWLGLAAFLSGSRLAYGLVNWGVWNDSWMDWLAVFDKAGMVYWGGYVGFLVVAAVVSWRNGWKYWAFLEDNVVGFLILIIFWLVGQALMAGFDGGMLRLAGVAMAGLAFSLAVEGKYRSFVWYKSGRKGFVFFWANFVFWLGRGVLSFVFDGGGKSLSLSVALVLIFAVGLFILGEVWSKE